MFKILAILTACWLTVAQAAPEETDSPLARHLAALATLQQQAQALQMESLALTIFLQTSPATAVEIPELPPNTEDIQQQRTVLHTLKTDAQQIREENRQLGAQIEHAREKLAVLQQQLAALLTAQKQLLEALPAVLENPAPNSEVTP